MANVINYHYSPKDERWVEGLAVLDRVDREQNQEKVYVLPNPNEINIKLPNGERKIMDITKPNQLRNRSYQNIVLKPGEYSFAPDGLHESFDDLEYWLGMVFPKSSLSKLREILGELIYPSDNRTIIINFVLTGKTEKEYRILKNQIKLILGLFPFDTQNIVDNVTHTIGTIKTELYKTKGRIRRWVPGQGRVWETGIITRRKYQYLWDINYKFKDWYRINELNHNTHQRLVMLNNEYYSGYGYRRRKLNNCSADTLAREFEYDTFIAEYIKQIKPKKQVLKHYGVDPIKIVRCNTVFPTMISYTYNEPLDKIKLKDEKHRKLFKVFQLKTETSHNFEQHTFVTNIHELTDKLHRWVLNGIIMKRNKVDREDIGLINVVLDRTNPDSDKVEQKMYFMK
jgi:hypothetical protein